MMKHLRAICMLNIITCFRHINNSSIGDKEQHKTYGQSNLRWLIIKNDRVSTSAHTLLMANDSNLVLMQMIFSRFINFLLHWKSSKNVKHEIVATGSFFQKAITPLIGVKIVETIDALCHVLFYFCTKGIDCAVQGFFKQYILFN
jgi:hypothetical protein